MEACFAIVTTMPSVRADSKRMDGDEKRAVLGGLEMRRKLQKVFQLVGSDRSQCAAELWRNSADRFVTSQNLARKARPAGLEPATPGLEGRCSIQLSYGRIVT